MKFKILKMFVAKRRFQMVKYDIPLTMHLSLGMIFLLLVYYPVQTTTLKAVQTKLGFIHPHCKLSCTRFVHPIRPIWRPMNCHFSAIPIWKDWKKLVSDTKMNFLKYSSSLPWYACCNSAARVVLTLFSVNCLLSAWCYCDHKKRTTNRSTRRFF